MANNETQLLENIEIQFVLAENEVQFEEKLKIFLSHVLKQLASPHEVVRKKAIEILNHIKKRTTKTVKLPWNLLAELVCSENFMRFTLLKNFTIVFLKMAYDRLTEKDKITHLLPLIKNIELKSHNLKKILFQIMLEFFQKLSLKLTDLETKEVVDSLYSLYECCRLLSCQKESLYQSQSLKFEIMCYLCKSKLAANIFPFMLHVSFDCLYSPKTNVNLQMKGADFIQWITRTADTSIVELIGKVLLFGLLEIIKETRIEKFNNLIREQEIIQTLLFKPFYGSPDLPIHNSEEAIDNEILKVIIIKFRELDQLDQFNQWANEEDVQAIINILEENIDESSHTIICCILKYAFNLFPFAPILKKIQSSNFFNIANLIYEKSTKCAHQLVDILQIRQSMSKNINHRKLDNIMLKIGCDHEIGIGVEKDEHKAFIYYQKSAEMGDADGMCSVGRCYKHGIGVEKDEHTAFVYYQKSADMGNATAMSDLGCCYEKGIGVKMDERKAFIYYQKSAEMGDAIGLNRLGFCYGHGTGVEKDEHKAFIYFQKSAEMGYNAGISNVGYCYQHGIGVEKDESKAFIYHKKSAEMRNGITINLAFCYQYGIGVEKDECKAFIYFQKTAEMGNALGMSKLGYCYRNGVGTTRDLQKANIWYKMYREKSSVSNEWMYESPDIDSNVKIALLEIKHPPLWISYEKFEDIRELGKGGFATIYQCVFRHEYNMIEVLDYVVLKLIHGSRDCPDEFIKELKAYCEIYDKVPSFLRCYGISQHNDSKDYIIVLEYAEMGSLRENLYNISSMKWEDKLILLHCIASDLLAMHSQNYIHRDLHSGNILQETLQSANIADLGLSVSTNKSSKIESNGVNGILPYIPPEVLNKQQYTKASDIYSFGIIMWEILFGTPITGIYAHLHKYIEPLEVQIVLNKLRPPIFENHESCYIYLMKRCWENDPEKRPSAAEVCGTFAEWQNDKKILFELNEYDKKMRQLMKGQLSINDNSKLSIVINNEVNYSKEIYTDRFFSFITSHPTSNHLESNADLLIINSKELIPENLD